ncbi:MAG: SRPBCC family protein [Ginsengibacter sp.]
MQSALRLVFFLIVLFFVVFLVSLLLPSKVTITKSVLINAPIEKIKNQITHFDQWKNWYPAFKDETGTVLKDSLQSNSVTLKKAGGKSIHLIISQLKPDVINVEVQSSSSSARVNYEFIFSSIANNEIQLTWNVNTQLGWYPWHRISGILLDKVSGAQYDSALADLKIAAEH